MPPITSPRRTVAHPTPAMARPMPIPPPSKCALGTTPSSTSTSPSSYGSFRPAPYMVALAGWPEPVFVAEARETWEKKHSRPPSPTGFREVRDGFGPAVPIPLSAFQHRDGVSHGGTPPSRLPPLGNEYRDGVAMDGVYGRSTGMARSGSGSMQVDSALRGSRGSSPLGRSSVSPDAPSPPGSHSHTRTYSHSHSSSHSRSHSGNSPPGTSAGGAHSYNASNSRGRRVHGFPDPRYAPNAPIIGARLAGLRVAPAWGSAAPRLGHTPGDGHNHHLHSHGAAPYPNRGGATSAAPRRVIVQHPTHIQRSVPEVWPPPKVAQPHLATAVYPRDPDSPWMWNMSNGSSAGASPHHHSASHSGMHSSNGSVSPLERMSPKPEDKARERKETADKDNVKYKHSNLVPNGKAAENEHQGKQTQHEDRMDVDDH